MTSKLSDRWLLVLLVGLAACGTDRVIYHAPPELPVSVTVSPNTVSLLCGQTVTLTATVVVSNPKDSPGVQWRTLNANVAEVDSSGLVHAYVPGFASILALSVADPTKAGIASVTVVGEALATLNISQVVEAGTGQPANLNAVTDSIDVTYNADGSGCLRGALPWVSVTARLTNGQDSLTATVPVPSSTTSVNVVTIRLNTAAKRGDGTPVLHNGTYTLAGVLLGSNGSTFRSANSVTLTVSN